jgi:hypothetical protein
MPSHEVPKKTCETESGEGVGISGDMWGDVGRMWCVGRNVDETVMPDYLIALSAFDQRRGSA